jgi:uncharacterized protein YneF (UPF0154 family)
MKEVILILFILLILVAFVIGGNNIELVNTQKETLQKETLQKETLQKETLQTEESKKIGFQVNYDNIPIYKSKNRNKVKFADLRRQRTYDKKTGNIIKDEIAPI